MDLGRTEKLLEVPTKSNHLPIKRWRSAFVNILCYRILLSLFQHTQGNRRRARSTLLPPASSYNVVGSRNNTEQTTFGVDQTRLSELFKSKNNVEGLLNLGGVEVLASALQTNAKCGILGDDKDLARRSESFGSNTYTKPPNSKHLSHFVKEAFIKDPLVLVLLACAALSLALGIREHGLRKGWRDGACIFVAVFIEIYVSSLSNLKQNMQFHKLFEDSNDIPVDAVRSGRHRRISISKVVVGDVICLSIGDQVPADGLFLQGHSLSVDESSITGDNNSVEVNSNQNPFLFSGSMVVDGYGKMLVASVGMNTKWGQKMSSISHNNDEEKTLTLMQARIHKVMSTLAKVGLVVALLALVVLLFHYFTGYKIDHDKSNGNEHERFKGRKTKFNDMANATEGILLSAVTIAVVAIPRWLPLAVTLTMAYSVKKMMANHKALVRRIAACETMPSVTVICTDKTGTLTSNQMEVIDFWVGQEAMEDYSSIAPLVPEMMQEGVALNTAGSVFKIISDSPDSEEQFEYSGAPTEKAILKWAVLKMNMDMEQRTESCTILNVMAFNTHRKRSGILMKRKSDNSVHVHWKGAPEMILANCSSFYDSSGTIKELDDSSKRRFEAIIEGMAARGLRCVAFAHAQLVPEEVERLREEGLTLLGVVGIKDPCRVGAKQAVQECLNAGIDVKLITGDHMFLAKAVATECGILTPNNNNDYSEAIIEGKIFSGCPAEERLEKVDKIRVMARSTPSDKLLMVRTLKRKGHVVAATGSDINDAPVLKEADIALSMGNHGTQVAKENSDIIILDNNFCSVATLIRWGRWIHSNNKKFINIQLTANSVALVINFVAVVIDAEIPLTALNLFWINMIIYLVGGVALASEKPTRELMETPPVEQSETPITNIKWRNQLGLVLSQIAVLLALQFGGISILGADAKTTGTLIFNFFVLYQVFNQFHGGMNQLPISQMLQFVSPSNAASSS